MAVNDRPVVNSMFYDENGNAAVIDVKGVQVSSGPGQAIARGIVAGLTGVVGGYVATSSTSIVALRATTYTEQAANFTATIVSSSASDASAGTGSRTVKITYYDQTMAGPFTETVTMNGTTNVTSTNTNYCYIEKLETVTVGSNGTNVGTISIKNGGTTVGTIAISDGETFWAHHYVATSNTCFVRRILLGTNNTSGSALVRVARPLTANSFELQVGGQIRVISAQPQQIYDMDDFPVAGPARITLYVKADVLTASTTFASMNYYEL